MDILKRTASLFLLALLPAAAGYAQADASFLITDIRVEGTKRSSVERIIAEAYVTPGSTVTESEIELAVRRVRRLPFIYDASARLERGSAPGSHVLVLDVVETTPFFVSASLESGDDPGFTAENALAGYRWFLGDRDVAYGAVGYGNNNTTAYAGWTRYGLFGGRGWGTLDFSRTVDSGNASVDFTSVELQLNYPLGGDHGIRLRTTYGIAEFPVSPSFETSPRARADGSQLEIGWYRDTTDDPLLPRRGTSLWLGAGTRHSENVSRRFAGPGDETEIETLDSDTVSFVGSLAGHRPISDRLTLHASGQLSHSRFDRESPAVTIPEFPVFYATTGNSSTASVSGGISGELWDEALAARRGELRWEVNLGAGYAHFEQDLVPAGGGPTLSGGSDSWGASYGAGLVYRNRFGLLRVRFTGVEDDL